MCTMYICIYIYCTIYYTTYIIYILIIQYYMYYLCVQLYIYIYVYVNDSNSMSHLAHMTSLLCQTSKNIFRLGNHTDSGLFCCGWLQGSAAVTVLSKLAFAAFACSAAPKSSMICLILEDFGQPLHVIRREPKLPMQSPCRRRLEWGPIEREWLGFQAATKYENTQKTSGANIQYGRTTLTYPRGQATWPAPAFEPSP